MTTPDADDRKALALLDALTGTTRWGDALARLDAPASLPPYNHHRYLWQLTHGVAPHPARRADDRA